VVTNEKRFRTSLGLAIWALSACLTQAIAQSRVVIGETVTRTGATVGGISIVVRTASGEVRAVSDARGEFRLELAPGEFRLLVSGPGIVDQTIDYRIRTGDERLRIEIEYLIPPLIDSVIIRGVALDPTIDQRNDEIYRNTLFGRDDQLIQTLNAGISAGQHEGGGKSLEIRRFGFNLDHGGVNGGLKIMVGNVPQNQGTQGHGQGYLGQMKSLTPELVEDVEVVNGPFSAQYGDFSGLGVVNIRMKETLADILTLRMQGGSFGARRLFTAWSPELRRARALIAWDGSYTDGPFISPAGYRRDNLTGVYTRELGGAETLGSRINLGMNSFNSSGQIPLDEVLAGRLDRFGLLDKDNGGRVSTGTLSVWYQKDSGSAGVLKLDGFVGRSLFDLYSNFTSFLTDEEFGDEIQQHDSRLEEAGNITYLKPYRIGAGDALLSAGGGIHSSQINVGLYPTMGRVPNRLEANRQRGLDNSGVILTRADANVTNLSTFLQQAFSLFRNRLRLEGGLRYDYFRYAISNGINQTPINNLSFAGVVGAGNFQPKAAVSYTLSDRLPLRLQFNYGRGINSRDARGAIQRPDGRTVATTDFYQAGTSFVTSRLSLSANTFLIDHSNEQVYIPDDGSFEFLGPSRATGYEVRFSAQPAPFLTLSGGLTQVTNAFYRNTNPRIYVDRAPHTVADTRLTFAGQRGLFATIAWRHVSSYRLDGEDPTNRASGLDVVDLALRQRLHPAIDLNLSIDNLTDKRYFETQNYYESRLRGGDLPASRIHATPGYSRCLTVGLTIRLGGK